jgi:predicted nuclease of predicted toxin-antitoxin system
MSAFALRFLADESCDFAVVRALRAEGHDVLAVSKEMRRSDDRELIDQASREKRILLTEDKDFGWLVFVSHADLAGVILIRFPGNARQTLVQTVRQLVQEQGKRLLGAFDVVLKSVCVRVNRAKWIQGKPIEQQPRRWPALVGGARCCVGSMI